MKVAFIVNPVSGGNAGARHWAKAEPHVKKLWGDNATVFFTKHGGHAIQLTVEAIEQGYDVVVATGGDGTINEVANGYLQAGGKEKGVRMALLPSGTGGDFRRSVGLFKAKTEAVLQTINDGNTVDIDVGRIDYNRRSDNSPATRYFVNIASLGIGASICKTVASSSKVLGGEITYTLHSAYHTLFGFSMAPIRIRVDDDVDHTKNIFICAIANARYFGGGMRVAPDADVMDGQFDVVYLEDIGKAQAVFSLTSQIRSGTHIARNSNITQGRGRTVIAEPANPTDKLPMEADGEIIDGDLPARFSVVPAAISMILPATIPAASSSTLPSSASTGSTVEASASSSTVPVASSEQISEQISEQADQ